LGCTYIYFFDHLDKGNVRLFILFYSQTIHVGGVKTV